MRPTAAGSGARAGASLLAAVLVLAGCGDVGAPGGEGSEGAGEPPGSSAEVPGASDTGPDAAPGSGTIRIHLLAGEDLVPVERPVEPDASSEARLAAALRALLAGPTPAEREAGLLPPFGPAGPEVLDSVRLHPDGRAVVDFGDLPSAYPSGSASAAGSALLASLEATLFQWDEVREALVRVEGSCDAFWNWLQRDCAVLTRDGPRSVGPDARGPGTRARPLRAR